MRLASRREDEQESGDRAPSLCIVERVEGGRGEDGDDLRVEVV